MGREAFNKRIKYQEPPDALLHADSQRRIAWRIGSLRNGLNRLGRRDSLRSFNETANVIEVFGKSLVNLAIETAVTAMRNQK